MTTYDIYISLFEAVATARAQGTAEADLETQLDALDALWLLLSQGERVDAYTHAEKRGWLLVDEPHRRFEAEQGEE